MGNFNYQTIYIESNKHMTPQLFYCLKYVDDLRIYFK